MPPKKAEETGDKPAIEPRRSGRITAKPAQEQEPKKRAAQPRKRKAAEDDSESTSKKAKGEDEPQDSATSKLTAINEGDSLPELTLKNEKGEDVEISKLAEEKGVVLFLVPKADTPGCTVQACGFRDSYPDFSGSGFDVYCLSADTSTSQQKWQTKKELPYPLISDPKRVLITALGAGDGGKTKRSHFIFEKGGKLLTKKIPVKPADSPKLALEFIKNLQ